MYHKAIKTSKEISKEEAQSLITEVTMPFYKEDGGKLFAYQNINGMLYRLFTLEIPEGWRETKDEDFLLSYARANMPEDLRFG